MEHKVICKDCGAEFVCATQRAATMTKYCAECGKRRKHDSTAKSKAQKDSGLRNIATRIVKCATCGEPIVTHSTRKKVCDKCLRKRQYARENERRRKLRLKAPVVKEKRPSEIGERVKEAAALGLSYGRYMALLSIGKIKKPPGTIRRQASEKK